DRGFRRSVLGRPSSAAPRLLRRHRHPRQRSCVRRQRRAQGRRPHRGEADRGVGPRPDRPPARAPPGGGAGSGTGTPGARAIRRMAMVGRIAAAVAVLLFFGVLTRWEPSVLRAIAMVAASLAAWAMGRPVSRLRLLALAVAGLLVIDPLLVNSVGFLLSVGAC